QHQRRLETVDRVLHRAGGHLRAPFLSQRDGARIGRPFRAETHARRQGERQRQGGGGRGETHRILLERGSAARVLAAVGHEPDCYHGLSIRAMKNPSVPSRPGVRRIPPPCATPSGSAGGAARHPAWVWRNQSTCPAPSSSSTEQV